MPTKDERLVHVTLKVKRAKEHVAELERELRSFLNANPYKVAAKRDPQTRKLIYYIASVEPTPSCLPLIAGDAIQNVMGALDHLAYQIVCSDTGDKPPRAHRIYFPIFDDAAKYKAEKGGKIEGALQDSFDAIDAIKPYKGGNDLLWVLGRLNNIEKHRLLLTVGSLAAGFNMSQVMANNLKGKMDPAFVAMIERMDVFLNFADKGFPLKAGFELFIDAVDAEPNPKQQFRFDIALNEPGVIEGKPLLETVHQLVNLVEGIVTALTPRLK